MINKAMLTSVLKQRRTHNFILIYFLVVLLILFPLLKPGFILTLDMIWVPHFPYPREVTSLYVLQLVLFALTNFLPSQLMQKVILFLMLLLMGVGMHRFVTFVYPKIHPAAAYFSGLLFMINPFTYERFMDGQWPVLLGYAMFPFVISAQWRFFRNVTFRSALEVAVWSVVITTISIHTSYMIGVFFVLLLAEKIWGMQHKTVSLRRLLLLTLFIGSIFVLGHSYWLRPFLLGITNQGETFQSIDDRHLLLFRTAKDPALGVPLNVLALFGYWGEREDRFLLTKEINPYWFSIFIGIFVLVLIGVVYDWRQNKGRMIAFTSAGFIAWIVSMGVIVPEVAAINKWLLENMPFFSGYREPQKFVTLLAFLYSYFGALGVQSLLQKIKHIPYLYRGSVLVAVMLPFIYTPLMLWGFAGQLKPTDYPQDWYIVENQLSEDQDSYKILFLPWHQYMWFSFSHRIIANPAKYFFTHPVIQGNNPEIGELEQKSANLEQMVIEETILNNRNEITNLGTRLSPLKVKYIVLAKEVDWEKYSFLDRQNDLDLLAETASIKVYRNKSYSH